jgi:hypothetical protein
VSNIAFLGCGEREDPPGVDEMNNTFTIVSQLQKNVIAKCPSIVKKKQLAGRKDYAQTLK